MKRADVVAEVEALAGDSPEIIAQRIGMTPGAIAKALIREGHDAAARPFTRLDMDTRLKRAAS